MLARTNTTLPSQRINRWQMKNVLFLTLAAGWRFWTDRESVEAEINRVGRRSGEIGTGFETGPQGEEEREEVGGRQAGRTFETAESRRKRDCEETVENKQRQLTYFNFSRYSINGKCFISFSWIFGLAFVSRETEGKIKFIAVTYK